MLTASMLFEMRVNLAGRLFTTTDAIKIERNDTSAGGVWLTLKYAGHEMAKYLSRAIVSDAEILAGAIGVLIERFTDRVASRGTLTPDQFSYLRSCIAVRLHSTGERIEISQRTPLPGDDLQLTIKWGGVVLQKNLPQYLVSTDDVNILSAYFASVADEFAGLVTAAADGAAIAQSQATTLLPERIRYVQTVVSSILLHDLRLTVPISEVIVSQHPFRSGVNMGIAWAGLHLSRFIPGSVLNNSSQLAQAIGLHAASFADEVRRNTLLAGHPPTCVCIGCEGIRQSTSPTGMTVGEARAEYQRNGGHVVGHTGEQYVGEDGDVYSRAPRPAGDPAPPPCQCLMCTNARSRTQGNFGEWARSLPVYNAPAPAPAPADPTWMPIADCNCSACEDARRRASQNSSQQDLDSDAGRGYYNNHRPADDENPPRRNLKMNAVRKFNQGRKFGVELEISSTDSTHDLAKKITEAGIECYSEQYGHSVPTSWKIVTDSSVNGSAGGYGMEVVSPPMSGKAGLEQIKAVCKVLTANGCKVNKTCGMHVHHDASDFTTVGPFKNVLKLYGRLEARLDAAFPDSRRLSKNIYCKSILEMLTVRDWNGTTGADRLDRCTTPREVRNWYRADRYFKVNLESFWRQQTVEFRHHAGTIDAEKIVNWVVLTQVVVETSVANEVIDFAVVEGEKIGKVLGLTAKWGTNDSYIKAAVMHMKKRLERMAAAA